MTAICATGATRRQAESIPIPLDWFYKPLRATMAKLIRPCTSLTRRKQLTIKVDLPRQAFEKLMQPLGESDVEGLTRTAGQLEPTKKTTSLLHFKYKVAKGSVSSKLWRLDELDLPRGDSNRGRPAAIPRVRPIPYKRGAGCARLHLGRIAGARGEKGKAMAMVCGNVLLHYKEPVKQRAMPTLTIHFFVLSMDKNGHIIWPTNFDTLTSATLRKQARGLMKQMLDDPLYPIDPTAVAALTQSSSSLLSSQQAQRRAAHEA